MMSEYMIKRQSAKLGIVTKETVKEIPKMNAIKKRSKKMTKDMKVYNKEKKAFLIDNPICPITGEPTTDIHHKAGRVGKMLLDQKYWLAVSRKGHKQIEENPVWAKENGYSISRLKKAA